MPTHNIFSTVSVVHVCCKMYLLTFIFTFFIGSKLIYLRCLTKTNRLSGFFLDAFCFFKVFNYHSDIADPNMWVGHQKAKDCSGVIFTKNFHSVYIKRLKAAQLLLPQHGSIYITNRGYLEINADFSNSCE